MLFCFSSCYFRRFAGLSTIFRGSGGTMAYTKKMGADSPGFILFVVDQSGSMNADWVGSQLLQPVAKAEALADIINTAINEIGARSVKGSEISPRCDLAIIGYGGGGVSSQWSGALAGKDIVSIKEVIPNPLGEEDTVVKLSDGRGGLVDVEKKVKYWLDPKADGGTPMGLALSEARQQIEQWLHDPLHQRSFPPIVIHCTDGLPQDEPSALREAENIKRLRTEEGHVLLIDIHLPEGVTYPVVYPVSSADLPPGNVAANLLFAMSSVMPDEMLASATDSQLPVKPGCKLMIVNGNATSVTQLIQWGSSRGQDAPSRND
jgi:hypothetical protein